jgi:hypothetical protein
MKNRKCQNREATKNRNASKRGAQHRTPPKAALLLALRCVRCFAIL